MPSRMGDRQAARRKRATGRLHSACDGQETWKSGVKEVLADIRASSPTLRAFRENGARLKESYEALRRALARAQKQKQAPQNRHLGHGQQGVPTDISKLLKDVGSKEESKLYAAGALVFGFGLFLAGAAPWLLPACFILFTALCFPWRAYTFAKRKWGFFLLDFCYVSAATLLGSTCVCARIPGVRVAVLHARLYWPGSALTALRMLRSGATLPLWPTCSSRPTTGSWVPWCTRWQTGPWPQRSSPGRAHGSSGPLSTPSGMHGVAVVLPS